MTYDEAMEYNESLKGGGMKFGLERMARILDLLAHPERRQRFVHVAGTNGKGSTARMIQAILTASGYRVGLYSSPAVTGLLDTVTIDGVSITEREYAGLAKRIRSHQSEMGSAGELSEFEFNTALAFLFFADRHTDICVVECGLGGRDDATNIIQPPLAAVITPVSLDHINILGSTVKEITENKCGIIKPPCCVITSPDQDENALAVILETAASCGLTVRIPSPGAVKSRKLSLGLTEFQYDGLRVTLSLTGGFQIGNALTAVETVLSLGKAGFYASEEQIIHGLSQVKMPCRQEVIHRSPLVLIDGGHNIQGVTALAETLSRYDTGKFTLITGMLADKDVEGCMRLLAPFCNRVICCTPGNPRALPASKLAGIMNRIKPEIKAEIADSSAQALAMARRDSGVPLLVAGSFYIAGLIRALLLND